MEGLDAGDDLVEASLHGDGIELVLLSGLDNTVPAVHACERARDMSACSETFLDQEVLDLERTGLVVQPGADFENLDGGCGRRRRHLLSLAPVQLAGNIEKNPMASSCLLQRGNGWSRLTLGLSKVMRAAS